MAAGRAVDGHLNRLVEIHWNHDMSQAMNQEASTKAADGKYYTFRVRKRDVHGLACVFTLWFLWSEGAEIARLFGNVFSALI